MRNPLPALLSTLYGIRLWVRDVLPWRTKSKLREELQCACDERDGLHSGLTVYQEAIVTVSREREGLEEETSKLRREATEEREARVKLEGDRIAEHGAVRGLMFNLSNALGATLKGVDDFIVQLPDYTPDQAEREQVMLRLTEQVHKGLTKQVH